MPKHEQLENRLGKYFALICKRFYCTYTSYTLYIYTAYVYGIAFSIMKMLSSFYGFNNVCFEGRQLLVQ